MLSFGGPLQECLLLDPDDGLMKIWSEAHVSEDFQIAMTLQTKVSSAIVTELTSGLRDPMGHIQSGRVRRGRLPHLRRRAQSLAKILVRVL